MDAKENKNLSYRQNLTHIHVPSATSYDGSIQYIKWRTLYNKGLTRYII